MIKSVGEMLEALRQTEAAKLGEHGIRHASTIGAMYEGLTRSLLNRTFPASMALQVVSGFVVDGYGASSGQIDCMLVRGQGRSVPYVPDVYEWHVRDVIAAFEVKKNLFGSELADAHDQLLQVAKVYSSWVQRAEEGNKFYLGPSLRAFSECTGRVLPSTGPESDMDSADRLIWHTIMTDQISPIRIVLGYGGYSTEYELRRGFLRFLDANLNRLGFGAPSLPNLFIAKGASLVKMSGHPYCAALDVNGWWPLVTSTHHNPIQLILELLWTRISHYHSIVPWFGEDLEVERLSPLIDAKPQERSPGSTEWGWQYRGWQLTAEQLSDAPSTFPWQPVELDLNRYIVVDLLCREESLSATDPRVLSLAEEAGYDAEHFLSSLVETSLVARDGNRLVLTTVECRTVILPDGRLIAADDNTRRLTRWLERYMSDREDVAQGA
ncbi:DUF6602 domain-containing protein [Sphingomonas sp. CFBP8993]|uniref:DUF6602 domain-containing protein n=1 Tax=Sphingomonas sp. CFBP8993 TaxID=3096526 RepID=UPI002A6A9C7D|nr:DUF6602 domain-containing protein [Sphingomonas sp. CFBP8993]MDY0957749.1 DUF6602 domain-containing protein [Sphingomonas sp. CFBP8993]